MVNGLGDGGFDPTLGALNTAMNLRLINQNVIASNIANADTPGYKAQRLEFEGALREALGKALSQIIKGRKERVAIIASGGMSHFPGTTKYLHPEFDFDRCLTPALRSAPCRP